MSASADEPVPGSGRRSPASAAAPIRSCRRSAPRPSACRARCTRHHRGRRRPAAPRPPARAGSFRRHPGPVRVRIEVVARRASRIGDLLRATDEAGELVRQVVRKRFERSDRGKFRAQLGPEDLVQPYRRREILEPMLPEIAEARPRPAAPCRSARAPPPREGSGRHGRRRRCAPPGGRRSRRSPRPRSTARRCAGPSGPARRHPPAIGGSPIARCASMQASSAARAVGKETNRPSPAASTWLPPCAAMASLTSRWWSVSSVAYASPSCSRRRVDPSMSVKSRLTVPDGSALVSRWRGLHHHPPASRMSRCRTRPATVRR